MALRTTEETEAAYERLKNTPLQRPVSLTDMAYDRIRGSLLNGDLAPGDVLSVVKLAEALDMSRSPVRSATERIASEGLIIQRGGNLIVRTMHREDVLDALAVRAPLEALASELAAPHLGPDDLRSLDEIQVQFERAVHDDDTRAARQMDLHFHHTIQQHAGNPVLVEHLERLQAQVILATYAAAWGASQHRAVAEHAKILECLHAGDAPAAGRAASKHVDNARRRVAKEWPETPRLL